MLPEMKWSLIRGKLWSNPRVQIIVINCHVQLWVTTGMTQRGLGALAVLSSAMTNQQDTPDPSSEQPPSNSQEPQATKPVPRNDYGDTSRTSNGKWPTWLVVLFSIFMIVVVLPLLGIFVLFLICLTQKPGHW